MKRNIRMFFCMLVTALGLSFAPVGFADDVPDPMVEVTTVNINDADAETLAEVLDGIGMSRAEAIVAYRTAHGPFYSAEELTAVRGIGESTVAKNEKKIRVE